MKRTIALLLALCLLPCAMLCCQAEAVQEEQAVSLYDVRYYFEHRMLRDYFFNSRGTLVSYLRRNGAFFLWDDLANNNGWGGAYEENQFGMMEFPQEDGTQVLLLLMPKPEKTPLCSRIYMCWNPETGAAGYYTVEYDNFFGDSWFLCGWLENGNHVNYRSAAALPDPGDPEYENALSAELKAVLDLMASK